MAPRSEEEQHVAAIRSEYGKGEGGPELSQAVRGSLQAACQLLSEQLYNTDAHFLSELIQNADDNAYAPGVRPQLVIKLLDRGMSLRNNELGFEARNVTAICALGNSSKSKAQGQTGEKGGLTHVLHACMHAMHACACMRRLRVRACDACMCVHVCSSSMHAGMHAVSRVQSPLLALLALLSLGDSAQLSGGL